MEREWGGGEEGRERKKERRREGRRKRFSVAITGKRCLGS